MASLFSPAADGHLEELAQASTAITKTRFGNIIQLYAPLYISNECDNSCLYCGFNRNTQIRRSTLSMEQVIDEADLLYRRGFRHLLLLTGESKGAVPLDTLAGIASAVHKRFASVSIEVYPMEVKEYQLMEKSGVDGLTIYQETYNRIIYDDIHPAGKKRDFGWRLEAPDRGGKAGFRKMGIGALLGLSDWRIDGFFTALHALYLTRKFWRSHIQVSFPRLRGAPGNFKPLADVSDRDLTHLICAMRILLPDAGLVLSTREPDHLRDNLFPLGITMMSAGSRTEPGGYSGLDIADNQFPVIDSRSPEEISEMIRKKGYDPVWKDWDSAFIP
jgi:2-iminoacetate synthase